MQPYKGKKYVDKDEDDHGKHSKKYKMKSQDCPNGIFCDNLIILNGCKKKHHPDDKKLAQVVEDIKKDQVFLLVFQPQQNGELKPKCLMQELLPIEIIQTKSKSQKSQWKEVNSKEKKQEKQDKMKEKQEKNEADKDQEKCKNEEEIKQNKGQQNKMKNKEKEEEEESKEMENKSKQKQYSQKQKIIDKDNEKEGNKKQEKQKRKDEQDQGYKAGYYYDATYIGINKEKKTIMAQIVKQVGKYGDARLEADLLLQIGHPKFQLAKRLNNEKLLSGSINMNHDRVLVLKNSSGNQGHKPIYFDNKGSKLYPIAQGCTVKYYLDRQDPRIIEIKYDQFKFTGILQIDKHGAFYVKCRNWRHETIDIANVPSSLRESIKLIEKFIPYSIFRNRPVNQQDQTILNQELKKFLMKGHFIDWPITRYNALGILEEEYAPFTLKNLKEAVIYQYMINPVKHSQKEKKQSKKLLEKLEKDHQKQTKNPREEYVFTIDGRGTACHDDALSVVSSPASQTNEKTFRIGIHISDVDEYVAANSQIDLQVRKNDKTTYIKGYYNPMFFAPLMKFFSLSHNNNKIVYSLFFTLTTKGTIDFNSIQFKQSCVKIHKNYFHSPRLREQKALTDFFEASQILKTSNILKGNSLGLDQESETETGIDSLMLISSMLPTFMWKLNMKRVDSVKKNVDQFVKNLVDKIQLLIKDWEKSFKSIKQAEKEMSKLTTQKSSIIKAINKKVDAQIRKLQQQLKLKKKLEKQQKKQQKKQKQSKQTQEQSSEQQAEQENEIKTVQSLSEVAQKQLQLKQLKQQEQREKKIKETLNKKVTIGNKKQVEEDSESSSQSSEDQISRDEEKRKMSQAEAALRYLTKVFDVLKVDIRWIDRKQIKRKFEEAKQYDDSQLFKEYIKRMYILNHQHFKYLIKINEDKNRQQAKNRQNEDEQNEDQSKNKKKYTKKQDYKQGEQKEPREQREQREQKDKNEKKKMEEIIIEKIVVDFDGYGANEMTKKKLKEIAFDKGREIFKKIKCVKFVFNIFSENMIDKGLIGYASEPKMAEDLKARFLKEVLLFIKIKYEQRVDEKKWKETRQLVFEKAKKMYQDLIKDGLNEEALVEKSKDFQNKAEEQAKNASLEKIMELGELAKQFKKICCEKPKAEEEAQKKDTKDKLDGEQKKKDKKQQNKQKKNIQNQQRINGIKQFFSFIKATKHAQHTLEIEDRNKQETKIELTKAQNTIQQQQTPKEQDEQSKAQPIRPSTTTLFSQDFYSSLTTPKHKIFSQLTKSHFLSTINEDIMKGFKRMVKSVSRLIENKFDKDWKNRKLYEMHPGDLLDVLLNIAELCLVNQKAGFGEIGEVYCYCSLVEEEVFQIYRKYIAKKIKKDAPKKEFQKKQENDIKMEKPTQKIEENGEKDTKKKEQANSQVEDKTALQKQEEQQKNKKQKQGDIKIQQPTQKMEENVKNEKQVGNQKIPKEKKKSSKNQERKLIQQKRKQLLEAFKAEKNEQLQKTEENLNNANKAVVDMKTEFKESLIKVEQDYNILQYMQEKLKLKSKKGDKKKKKNQSKQKDHFGDDEQQEEQDYQFVKKICEIMDQYLKKSGQKFKLMKVSEIQEVLFKRVDMSVATCIDNKKLNQQFSQLSKDEDRLLKWNNPIRSYDALETMRAIKDFQWLFNSKLSPLDILIDFKALKQLKSRISGIQKSKLQKLESEQSDKKHKEANREIEKIEFFYRIKNEPNQIHKLLNIVTLSSYGKKVYHPSLGEIEVKNRTFQQDMFRVVDAKLEIICEFPIEVKAVLLK